MGKREKKKIRGTKERPRLTVFRSNKHIYAQVIDDLNSSTLFSCSTLDLEIKNVVKSTANIEASQKVGENLGKKLLDQSITKVIFDRKNKAYHGRVKALAEGARIAGLNF